MTAEKQFDEVFDETIEKIDKSLGRIYKLNGGRDIDRPSGKHLSLKKFEHAQRVFKKMSDNPLLESEDDHADEEEGEEEENGTDEQPLSHINGNVKSIKEE